MSVSVIIDPVCFQLDHLNHFVPISEKNPGAKKKFISRSRSSTSSDSVPTSTRPVVEDVCPWESVNPPSVVSGSSSNKTKGVLLTPVPSVDHEGPALTAKPTVESRASTDLDICPWESVVLPAASGVRSRTPIPSKSSTEVVAPDDVVCPWESQDLVDVVATPQPTLPTGSAVRHPETHPHKTSEVTVIVLNPAKQQHSSPVLSPAGTSRKDSASGITGTQPESDQTATLQLDKSSAKLSDICPWEDE